MINKNVEQTSRENYEENGIDLEQYVKVLIKRKKTFILIFLLIFAIGLAKIVFSPKIYRISNMIQPPVNGEVLTGADDLESAENLRNLIVNGAFNQALSKKMSLNSALNSLKFNVDIPSSTNILQVSIDVESKKKEFGMEALRALVEVISDSYTKRIDARIADMTNQIKFNENAIANGKEKIRNMQEQIKEITSREDKIREEILSVNSNMEKILNKGGRLLGDSPGMDNSYTLLIANYIQNNYIYLNRLNDQLIELFLHKASLNYELKSIDSQMKDFQMAIDKLKINKELVLNLRILSQPKCSPYPISPNKKNILAVYLIMGSFFGVLAVFSQEFLKKYRKIS